MWTRKWKGKERPGIVSQNLHFCLKLEKLSGIQFLWETEPRQVKDKIESLPDRFGRESLPDRLWLGEKASSTGILSSKCNNCGIKTL